MIRPAPLDCLSFILQLTYSGPYFLFASTTNSSPLDTKILDPPLQDSIYSGLQVCMHLMQLIWARNLFASMIIPLFASIILQDPVLGSQRRFTEWSCCSGCSCKSYNQRGN